MPPFTTAPASAGTALRSRTAATCASKRADCVLNRPSINTIMPNHTRAGCPRAHAVTSGSSPGLTVLLAFMSVLTYCHEDTHEL